MPARAVVQRQAMVKFAVLNRFSAVGGVVQMGVLDESASLKRGAYLMDLNLSSDAMLRWDDRSCVAPLGLIGCGIGSDTLIGLGVSVAAGRWVPSRLQITAGGGIILQSPSCSQEGLHRVVDGRLVSVLPTPARPQLEEQGHNDAS